MQFNNQQQQTIGTQPLCISGTSYPVTHGFHNLHFPVLPTISVTIIDETRLCVYIFHLRTQCPQYDVFLCAATDDSPLGKTQECPAPFCAAFVSTCIFGSHDHPVESDCCKLHMRRLSDLSMIVIDAFPLYSRVYSVPLAVPVLGNGPYPHFESADYTYIHVVTHGLMLDRVINFIYKSIYAASTICNSRSTGSDKSEQPRAVLVSEVPPRFLFFGATPTTTTNNLASLAGDVNSAGDAFRVHQSSSFRDINNSSGVIPIDNSGHTFWSLNFSSSEFAVSDLADTDILSSNFELNSYWASLNHAVFYFAHIPSTLVVELRNSCLALWLAVGATIGLIMYNASFFTKRETPATRGRSRFRFNPDSKMMVLLLNFWASYVAAQTDQTIAVCALNPTYCSYTADLTLCSAGGGVTCAGTVVTQINFANKVLTQTIPTELGILTGLTTLTLTNYTLIGSIPTELGACTGLLSLQLNQNLIGGALPTELGQLSLLNSLRLFTNLIIGSIPTELGRCTSLKLLNLNSNSLQSTIPTELGLITTLTNLQLRSNSIYGTIPTELGLLKALVQVFVELNSLQGTIPKEIFSLTKLNFLTMGSNKLNGTIPTEVGMLSAFIYISVRSNSLTGTIPTEIGMLANLTAFSVQSNSLHGTIPTQLYLLTNLLNCPLGINQLTGTLSTAIGYLTKLSYLSMNRNALNGTVPTQLGALSLLSNLDLSFNSFTGSVPAEIYALTSFTFLRLDHNSLTGVFPSSLSWNSVVNLNNLKMIKIAISAAKNGASFFLGGRTTGNIYFSPTYGTIIPNPGTYSAVNVSSNLQANSISADGTTLCVINSLSTSVFGCSSDSGITWYYTRSINGQPIPSSGGLGPYGVAVAGSGTAAIVLVSQSLKGFYGNPSSNSYIYQSTDAGVTWSTVLVGNNNVLTYDVACASSSVGVCLVGASSYYIFSTTDSGSTWASSTAAYSSNVGSFQNLAIGALGLDMVAVDSLSSFIVTGFRTPGTNVWTLTPVDMAAAPYISGSSLYGGFGVSASCGYTCQSVAIVDSLGAIFFYNSSVWYQLKTPPSSGSIFGVALSWDASNIFAVGDITTPSPSSVLGISFTGYSYTIPLSIAPSIPPSPYPSAVPTSAVPSQVPSLSPSWNPTTAPSYLVVPSITFIAPSTSSMCDNLTINVIATGDGGVSWSSAQWSISTPQSYSGSGLQPFNSLSVLYYAQPIIIPTVAFNNTPGVYTWSLTLTNSRGSSATASVSVNIVNDAIPSVSIIGSSMLSVTSAATVTIRSVGTPSQCDPLSRLSYSWAVYTSGVLQTDVTSTSIDPTVFIISSYSLTPGRVYTIQSTVTTSSGKSADSSANVTVLSGSVKAFISGGSILQWPIDQVLTLNASKSVDYNFKVPRLSFLWNCQYSTAGMSFSSCDTTIQTINQAATISIPALTLISNSTYLFSVTCSALDGRNDNAFVTVSVTGSGAPVVNVQYSSTVFYAANVAKINVREKLNMDGIVFSSSSTIANWYVSDLGAPVDINAISLTPTQTVLPAYGAAGVHFPLSLPGGVLTEGVTYTFTLLATVSGRVDLRSSGSLELTVNVAPKLGSVIASPSTGVALSDVFVFASSGWVDDLSDYPLQYDFSYQPEGQTVILQLSLRSAKSSTSSVLPLGPSSFNYSIDILNNVYDVWGATSTAATTVTVTNLAPTTKIKNILTNLLIQSGTNVESITSTCNAVASTLSQQNCVNAPNCALLNRQPCDSSTTPEQCGSCLTSFQGVSGSSNIPCVVFSNSSQTTSNITCSFNSQCPFLSCVGGVCIVPSKSCPNSCSGNGQCQILDASRNPVTSCLQSDSFCTATCACTGGFGGADCSLSSDVRMNREDSRKVMCSSLLNTISVQNPSASLLDSLASSFSVVFSPYEFSSAQNAADCINLFGNVSSLVQRGYLVGAATSTILIIANGISSLSTFNRIVSSVPLTASRSMSLLQIAPTAVPSLSADIVGSVDSLGLSSFLNSLSNGVHQDMVPGQLDVAISSASFNLKVSYPSAQQLYGALLTPSNPQGVNPQIQLPSSGLAACSGGSYLKVSVAQWSLNPYSNTSLLSTPLLRYAVEPATTGTSSQSNDGGVINAPFSIILPFSTTRAYNATTKLYANSTLPRCVQKSGDTFIPCGCSATSFNAYQVVFTCDSVQTLCPVSAGTIRSTNIIDNIVEYSSIYAREDAEISFILSHPAIPSLYASVVVGCLLFVMLCGTVVSIYWDKQDRRRIKDNVDRVHNRRVSRNYTGKQQVRDGSEFAFRKTSASVLEKKDVLPAEREASADIVTKMPPPPSPFLGGYSKLFRRFVEGVESNHYAVNFALGQVSMKKSRTIRFLTFSIVVLLHLMGSTVIFGVLYPSDNGCINYHDRISCESPDGYVEKLCRWSETQGCSIRPPPSTVTFIIAVAILTALVSSPIEIIVRYMMTEINSRRPSLESLGMKTSYWLGEEVVTKDFDNEYLAELNDTYWDSSEVKEVKSVLSAYVNGELGESAYFKTVIMDMGLVQSIEGGETILAVSWWKRLQGGPSTADGCILERIHRCKMEAFRLQKNLDSFDDEEDFNEKNLYLLERFMYENIRGYGQNLFKNTYLKDSRDLQVPIDGSIWLISWGVSICIVIFILYWILQWGSLNGDEVVAAWGSNYAASFFYTFILQEILIVLMTNVIFIEYLRPNLQSMYGGMIDVSATSSNDSEVVQILSPSCRVGQFPVNEHLPAAHILRCMSDKKISNILNTRDSQLERVDPVLNSLLLEK